MAIEKPISTIKKAVEFIAEDLPEPKDYKRIFDLLKEIRTENPKLLEKMLPIQAKAKELKKEMGAELYNTFSQHWNEIYDRYKKKLSEANQGSSFVKIILGLKEPKEVQFQKIRQEITNEVQNNSLLINAFSGKEELLKKVIEFAISEVFEFIHVPELRTLA